MSRKETVILVALIAAAVLIRLIYISQPFIDLWSWRQCDNAMIADNYYHKGFHFFYPQMSYTGNTPGYVGSEFPLITFGAALLYVPFGVQEWIGRSISIFFFSVSVPFFYLLVKRVANQRSAFLAAAIYALVPLSIFTSRSFMSDMPMLSFSIAALYLFSEWLDRPSTASFIGAGLSTSLAILVKLPGVIIGLPLLYMAWKTHGKRVFVRWQLWAFAAIALIPPILWYYHSYIVSTTSFPASLFWRPSILARSESANAYVMIVKRIATSSLTWPVFLLMLSGIALRWPARFGYVFHWWLVAIILFILFAANGNRRHDWYQLPVVPVAAALAGRAWDSALERLARSTRSKVVATCATVICFAALSCLAYIYTKPDYRSWATPAYKAGAEIDRLTPSDALVIVATTTCDPTALYYTKRRGWHFLEKDDWCFGGSPKTGQVAIENLENLRARGASYLVFDKYHFWWLDWYEELREHLDSHYERIRQTQDYIIFHLSAARPQ